MTTHISVRDARANLADLIGRAEDHHETFVLTNHGKPAAVLLSVYEFESLTETLEILSDKATMDRLAQSDKEIAEGDVVWVEPTQNSEVA